MLKAELFTGITDHVRHQTATKWVVHVALASKLMDLFVIDGLHGTACYKMINNNCHCFFACGKLILKDEQSGGLILGYIVDK